MTSRSSGSSTRNAARGYLKLAWGVVSLVAVLGAAVAAIMTGPEAMVAFAFGALSVAVGFTVSVWAVAAAERVDIRLTLPVGLLTYALKLVAFGLVLWWVTNAFSSVLLDFGVGIILGALTWLTVQASWTYRAKIEYIELP
ncbi:hypothetical protein [Haloglycomyces albus]|uniref:hypothetical protein n=1 Tax=Haloglycomyces albus TaxID=526067 RepID=UPI00046CDB5C|nr:hypothetical protein [Haloglycomyces albus]